MFFSRVSCTVSTLLMVSHAEQSSPVQLCGADMVLASYAASPEDALSSRTTDSGAAFAMLPKRDLHKCGIRGGQTALIDRAGALIKCGEMPGCFAVDYYPRRDGGTAYFCVEEELQSFGYIQDRDAGADFAHFYKVAGTSCTSLVSDQMASCDADGVLTNHGVSREDVLQSRTTSQTAAYASLPNDYLANCGAGAQPDTDISRRDAIAKCKALADCFAIDFYPGQNTAHYCTDPSQETLRMSKTTSRLRGGREARVYTEHLYKVSGAACSCTSATTSTDL